MPLPPLATPEGMTAYGYDQVSEALLARASTRVRRYTGQQITPGESTTSLTGVGPWLLPQRPVQAVTEVVDDHGNAVPPNRWELCGQHLHVHHGHVRTPLRVTYSHGLDTMPDELVELVCSIAARLGSVPAAMAAGATTEQAGGETITWGSDAYAGSTGLTSAEEKALATLFPKRPRTAQLHASLPRPRW